MALLSRTTFAKGWRPDADKVGGPPDALLRADNLQLDEDGVVGLRLGSTPIATGLGDVHSLYTAVLGGTRYRFAAGNLGDGTATVYQNGVSLAAGLTGGDTYPAGIGDVSFGTYLGQVLFARGGVKKKWDGTTLRNWGISMTGAAPTVAGIASDGKTFATFDSSESPAFVMGEDDGTGLTYTTGEDGTGNGALILHPNGTTKRGMITKTFASPTDFTAYDSGGVGGNDDLLELWVYVTEPSDLLSVTLMIDCNASSAQAFQDYYIHNFVPGDAGPLGPSDTTTLTPSIANAAPGVARQRGNAPITGNAVPRADFSPAKPISNTGWNLLAVRRSDMTRNGSTTSKDWTTIKAVRLVVTTSTPTLIEFDTLRIVSNPLNGSYKWAYVLAFNSGTYVGLSAPSALSAATQLQAAGATLTIPSDGSRDSQANECWLYRMGGVMDSFYRVAVKTGVSGTGSFTISDLTTDIDAMVANLKLQTDNTIPPNNILSLDGPYYDRVFVLTPSTLWPSRRINPDSFATGQAITVGGADETPYWVKKAQGGLYLGTSKDIYTITGTGAELPDGSVDFTKTPLNIDHPPVNDGVATDGNLLIYMSGDGWRAISGAGSSLLTAETALLYRGQTRHGVGPVNVTGGRFRAAVSKGQLACITPEGASTSSSPVLYRQAPARAQFNATYAAVSPWYRHVYPATFRSIYHEVDGTLLAGDSSGTVWQLDAGATTNATDNGALIPVTIWTKADDDGKPFTRKDPIDLRVQALTGGASLAIALHVDGADTPSLSVAMSSTPVGVVSNTLEPLPAFRLIQGRLTGSFSVFRFMSWGVQYVDLPLAMFGDLPRTNFGSPGLKRISGLQIRCCTFGVARTLTPFFDGVAQPGLVVTSSADEAIDVTYQCVAPIMTTEVSLGTDGDVELYDWKPLISATRPLGVKSWDSGPIDTGARELTWLRRLDLKILVGGPLTITAYIDEIPMATVTAAGSPGITTIVPVDLPRGTKGRQPRLVVTSPQPFYPYWIKVIERETGYGQEKTFKAIPVTLGDGGGGQ